LETEHQPALTASEISWIWTAYQSNSMAVCVLKHFLANVEDQTIRDVLHFALEISEKYIQEIAQIFEKETYPLPQAFTEGDINIDAPRLFTDALYLQYVENMGKFGMESYSVALTTTTRQDIYGLFSLAMADAIQLRDQAKALLLEKGLYHRDPGLPTPDQIDFVTSSKFLKGFSGDRRALLGTEISNLWFNSIRNGLGQALIQGFSQVAKNKEVRQYMERGREISAKHLEKFGSVLDQDYLSRGAFNLTGHVTTSKEAPFSDKLMMFHISALTASGVGQYGIAMSISPRHDLSVLYARLGAEIAHYANDGTKMMINHGWMEQPPEAANRKGLSE
jgi:hypothetical protein